MTDAEILRTLADKQAITELLYRYCRAVDRLDVALGHSVWHEDATADYGADYYQGPGKGVIDRICRDHLGTLYHSHQIANILIELDGDKAGSESYCTAALRLMRGDASFEINVCSRYVDSWSRRDGRWGLDHRVAIRDFDDIREIKPMSKCDAGRRDRDDPSYAVLRALP